MSPSTIKRAFYRCLSCCNVFAAEGPKLGDTARCVCDGKIDFMGWVGPKGRLFDAHERCACDARCTNARGPLCDCQCCGENHGTQAVVTVVVDQGAIPRPVVADADELRRRAAEYATARVPLKMRLEALYRRKLAEGWLDGPSFNELCELQRVLAKAKGLKTHKARIKVLTEAAHGEPKSTSA